MATRAQRLQILQRPRLAARLQRDDVVDLQAPRPPALDAAPAVPLQDLAARPAPTRPRHPGMMAAHSSPWLVWPDPRALWSVVKRLQNDDGQRVFGFGHRLHSPGALAVFLLFFKEVG